MARTRARVPAPAHTLERTRAEDAPDEAPWETAGEHDPPAAPPPWSAPEADLDDPGAIWYARALVTLQSVRRTLAKDAIGRALAQDTGTESLAVALTEHAALVSSETQREGLERMLDLARARRALLERAGGAASVDQVRELLGGISRQAVDKRRDRLGLLALRHGGEHRYPICQFHDGDVLQGFPDVLRAFTVKSPWTQLSVVVSAHDALDGLTIIEALQRGWVDEAIDVAASFGVTGA